MSQINLNSTLEDFLKDEERKCALLDTLRDELGSTKRDWTDLLDILQSEKLIDGSLTRRDFRITAMDNTQETADLILECLRTSQGSKATVKMLMRCMKQAGIDCSCLGELPPLLTMAVEESLQQPEVVDLCNFKGTPLRNSATASLLPNANRLFGKLSEKLVHDWTAVGMRLGLSHQDLATIESDNGTVQEYSRICLDLWSERQQPEPFLEHIVWALEKAKRNDCAELCHKHFHDVGKGVDPVKHQKQHQLMLAAALSSPDERKPTGSGIVLDPEKDFEFYQELAEMLTENNAWKSFGSTLGMDPATLTGIGNENSRTIEKGKACLQTWSDSVLHPPEGPGPLVEHLVWVADYMKRNDIVMFIRAKFKHAGDGIDPLSALPAE